MWQEKKKRINSQRKKGERRKNQARPDSLLHEQGEPARFTGNRKKRGIHQQKKKKRRSGGDGFNKLTHATDLALSQKSREKKDRKCR